MNLICSATARKRFGLSVSEPHVAAEWHEGWRLDMLQDAPCGYGAMVTNLETLFTILVPPAASEVLSRPTGSGQSPTCVAVAKWNIGALGLKAQSA